MQGSCLKSKYWRTDKFTICLSVLNSNTENIKPLTKPKATKLQTAKLTD